MATRHDELNYEHEDELLSELQSETGAGHEFGHEAMPEGSLEDEFGSAEGAHEFHEYGMGEYGELGLGEFGEGDQFFGRLKKIARGVGRFVNKHAGVFKKIGRFALPLVAGAVGGPLGGVLGKVAAQALREDELLGEDEFSHELLGEDELAGEFGSHELLGEALPELGGMGEVHEAMPESNYEVMAELMAEVAARAQHEAEAEAMAGAAAVSAISAADRAALKRLLPHLVRGVAVLTRVLRSQRVTRPAVRTIPTIVRQTVRTIRHRVAAGQPVSRRVAGQVNAGETRRVLSSPRACGAAIVRNVRATSRARPVAG
jgi:hypothetical protein